MSAKRTILVTGGNGFLGRRVVRFLLERGDMVQMIMRPGSEVPPPGAASIYCDLAGDFFASLRTQSGDIDGVVHLAQEPGWAKFPANSGKIAAVATSATAQLAEFAAERNAGVFVFASSGGVYGAGAEPLREDTALRPSGELGFYLNAKLAGDMLIRAFKPAPFRTSVLRFFFLYGPEQRDEFLVARLIGSISRGEKVRVAGGAGPKLNPLFVDDAARACVAALDGAAPEVVNVAGAQVITIAELATAIGREIGRKVEFDASGEAPLDLVSDITALMQFAPPCIGLEEGLTQTIKSWANGKVAS